MKAQTVSRAYQLLEADWKSKFDKYIESLNVVTDDAQREKLKSDAYEASEILDDFNNNFGGNNG